jgi:vacuolar protein sorting-associated protein 3
VDEFVYIQCLLETGSTMLAFCLFQGELDPRILISYFPDLRGTLLDANPTLEVFSGIAKRMPPYDSIGDISTSPLAPSPSRLPRGLPHITMTPPSPLLVANVLVLANLVFPLS